MPNATMNQTGTPPKVLRKAAQLGVHSDCIAAGPGHTCSTCALSIMQAYDFFYGHLESSVDVISAIIDDLWEDEL